MKVIELAKSYLLTLIRRVRASKLQAQQKIKNILALYFARQATKEMDRLWESNNWSDKTMEEWATENMRRPSKTLNNPS